MKDKKLLILYAFVILFIWTNSFAPASQSEQLSGGLTFQIYEFLNLKVNFDLFHAFIRKCAHFTEYTILGLIGFFSIKDQWKRMFVVSILIACIDEIIQLFVPGRSGQISDVLLDSSGIAFGCFIGFLFLKITSDKFDIKIAQEKKIE